MILSGSPVGWTSAEVGALNGILPLVGTMVWPVALVVLAALFRREISQASGRLGRVKYRDLELTFREDLRQVEALARAIPVPTPTEVTVAGPAALPTPGQPLMESDRHPNGPMLGGTMIVAAPPSGAAVPPAVSRRRNPPVEASPREVIVDAWAALGRTLIRAAVRRGDRRVPRSPIRADDAVRFLVMKGAITDDEARLFDALRKLWAQVDRLAGASLGDDEARRFAEATARLAARLADRT